VYSYVPRDAQNYTDYFPMQNYPNGSVYNIHGVFSVKWQFNFHGLCNFDKRQSAKG